MSAAATGHAAATDTLSDVAKSLDGVPDPNGALLAPKSQLVKPSAQMNSPMRQNSALSRALKPITSRVRTDIIALKFPGKPPGWTNRELTEDVLDKHFADGPYVGCCPIMAGESTTRLAILDGDSHKGETPWPAMIDVALQLCERLDMLNCRPIVFRSTGGKGWHIYILWDEPQDAHSVRSFLSDVLNSCGFSSGTGGVAKKQIEIFPRQDSVRVGGHGNMAILPLAGASEPLDYLLDLEPMGRDYVLMMDWPISQPVTQRDKPARAEASASPLVGTCDPNVLRTLSSALAAIPNEGAQELDYDDWLRIVFALHHATGGDDDGLALAHEFSARSDKYDPDFLDNRVWPFVRDREGAVTERTLFAQAREHGWAEDVTDDFEAINDTADEHSIGSMEQSARLESNIIELSSFDDTFDELPHLVDKLIPLGEVTLLAGHGGSGKSYVSLCMAVHVALGLPFGEFKTLQCKVLFFSAEDGATVLRKRLAGICRAIGVDVTELEGKLFLLDASDLDTALHREPAKRSRSNAETRLLRELSKLVQEKDAKLIVVDNASDTFDDDEIRRAPVRAFIRSLRTLLARPGRAVLLLAHVNKASATRSKDAGEEDYSGSTAWHNSARSRLSLKPDGKDRLKIEHVKANLGTKAAPMCLEWRNGAPVAINGTSPLAEAARAADEAVQKQCDDADKDALVALIQNFDHRGERVTTAMQGSCTVFRLLCVEKGYPKGVSKDRLSVLLRELEYAGRIFRGIKITPDRKKREVFTCLPARSNNAPILPDDTCA